MPRLACMVSALALSGLIGLAGCHAIPRGLRSDDLGPGSGRVDQPVPVSIGPTLRATMAALDDQGVHPQKLIISTLTEGAHQQGALGISPEATNAAMVPTGQRFDDLFVRHQFTNPGGAPVAFVPRFVTYKGETADGRAVLTTIATHRGDESSTLVAVRVGRTGDAPWSQALLARVVVHLNENEAAPTTPTSAPVQRAATLEAAGN